MTHGASLVTGGCGFVGRHLTRRLLAQGSEVWIVDDLSTGLPPRQWLGVEPQPLGDGVERFQTAAGRVHFVHEDVTLTLLRQLGRIPGLPPRALPSFDLAVALAAVVGGRAKIDGDPLSVGVDLGLDALFFYWLSRQPQAGLRVLYASSSAAYPTLLQGATGAVALREDMIAFEGGSLGQPDMTYGWSKLTGEYLSRIAARHYGLHVACVRPFSGYGEEQDLTYPVPAIAQRVARGDDPIEVWGSGEQGRDFVHIDDCITAMLLAAERIADGSGVNIGSGRLTTFRQLTELLLRLDGRNARIRPLLDKPVGVQNRYCDPSEMQRRLQWKPAISLEAGMGRVLDAARQRLRQSAHA